MVVGGMWGRSGYVQAAKERLLRARRVRKANTEVCRRIIIAGFQIEDAKGQLLYTWSVVDAMKICHACECGTSRGDVRIGGFGAMVVERRCQTCMFRTFHPGRCVAKMHAYT